MSAKELPSDLVAVISRYRLAFLVSVGDLGPHTTPQQPILESDRFRIAAPGPVTCRNIVVNPAVTLLYPPSASDEHALIIDGHATLRDYDLEIVPTHAVLHHVGVAASEPQRCSHCRRFNLAPPAVLSGSNAVEGVDRTG
ncbi:hypothetical protein [Nocardia sp. NBC_00511]|uniref:hypothetical protein n=1 Tax=Nocardia sp. NBC_00511 TaxID=2903591 RepID=UPI0030DF9336